MQSGQFYSMPQAHWVHLKSASLGFNEMLLQKHTFEHFKDFKDEGQRLPLQCPRKKDR